MELCVLLNPAVNRIKADLKDIIRAMKAHHPWQIVFGMVLVGGILITGCRRDREAPTKVTSVPAAPWVGASAPDFQLPSLSGGERRLSQLRGKVVLVNFWATWCVPCRAEMPALENLYVDFKGKGLEILAVSIDLPGEASVHSFAQDLHLTFPILLDSNFATDEAYQIRVVPTTLLVDTRGHITHRFLGAKDWNDEESRRLINRLIAEK
jgi:peroxiredoxin